MPMHNVYASCQWRESSLYIIIPYHFLLTRKCKKGFPAFISLRKKLEYTRTRLGFVTCHVLINFHHFMTFLAASRRSQGNSNQWPLSAAYARSMDRIDKKPKPPYFCIHREISWNRTRPYTIDFCQRHWTINQGKKEKGIIRPIYWLINQPVDQSANQSNHSNKSP